eukprot:CAMPEP_0201146088 /NCGR_PEP_ID=MMETSP0851-20130426/7797_1 /ASSEMBLY_ACC=CAM_ASM_000631 /TAXON_ID=183588 /ORGANISM="Pseudo-nitzschia fraudulenta, Strain WWA7" /LENGTH=536 /DNA_ID=CAMNT_0047421521 /DNA_START=475 /DNA_END=2085 /DNA_ORIENTATION=+
MQRSNSSGSNRSDNSDGSTQKIGLGARISQNIEMAKKGYEQLVHAIIRPPRARYKMENLGPEEFTFLGQRFRRDDVELLSSNVSTNDPTEGEKNNLEGGYQPTCSFLKIQASIWTRTQSNEDGDSDDDGGESDVPNPYNPDRHLPTGGDDEDVDRAAAPRAKHTMVVYLHGNASARVEVVPNLSFLLAQVGVFGVVGIDFTGSGKSDGDYVSLGYFERVDLECLIQYLKRVYGGRDGTDLEIILWGRSMGASTALMHAGKKSFTAKRTNSGGRNQRNNSFADGQEEVVHDVDAPDSSTVVSNRNGSSGSLNDSSIAENVTSENNSILKGLVCDSPFASLTLLCEELVERARQQGIVVPGVVVSVAIAMIARSVRNLANFNIREITPVEDVGNIDIPALFVVGADDDFITPHHSERLVEAYKGGVTTNLFMVPGGHNDARPEIVFLGIEEFCKQRLSLTEESGLEIPHALRSTIHQNPPWAYHRTIHFQAHERELSMRNQMPPNAANEAAETLGMTKDRQDDIQDKIGLMMGGQGRA